MKRKPDNKFGIVYVMQFGKYYKIGKANLKMQRFGEYTKLPEKPKYICVGVVLNALLIEDRLHKEFKHKRTRGEWFNLTTQELNRLCLFLETMSLFCLHDEWESIIGDQSTLYNVQLYYQQNNMQFDHNEAIKVIDKQKEFRAEFVNRTECNDYSELNIDSNYSWIN